jgi:hypothetical protein
MSSILYIVIEFIHKSGSYSGGECFMVRILFGIFMVAHGLVHLLYFGQGRRLFELGTGMVWPDGNWAFTRLLGVEPSRMLASVLCALAALLFAAGGIGFLARQDWGQPVVIGAAVLSTLVFILFWNGQLQNLSEQGIVAVMINAAILLVILVIKWPALKF